MSDYSASKKTKLDLLELKIKLFQKQKKYNL